MTDYSCYYFSVKWAGSNIDIASKLLLRGDFNNPAWLNSSRLQDQVGALVNIDPRSIKIVLGLPAGPQLTPVLLTPKVVLGKAKLEEMQLHKAMSAAWSSLKTGQVYSVYVTQHSPVALAVDKLASLCKRRCCWSSHAYTDLPLTLRRNPVVALAALDLRYRLHVRLPDELVANRQFAIAALSQTVVDDEHALVNYFSETLREDEEVVLKAIELHRLTLWRFPPSLLRNKAFMLRAVSISGLCIRAAAPTLRSDKDVALAAVRQHKKAFKFLSQALQADEDIQQVCNTAQRTQTD